MNIYMTSEELAKLTGRRRTHIYRFIDEYEKYLKKLGSLNDYQYTRDGRSMNGEAKKVYNLNHKQCNFIICNIVSGCKSTKIINLKLEIARKSDSNLKKFLT